jgi:hypothetical protein
MIRILIVVNLGLNLNNMLEQDKSEEYTLFKLQNHNNTSDSETEELDNMINDNIGNSMIDPSLLD